MEARVINDEGLDCRPEETGELWLKGKNVTPGYLDEPEANSALFSGNWLQSGDLASQSRDGFITIVGRKKSVIVSGGFNIHPDEVNEALLRHPDVIDAATVGIPDADWGELTTSAFESDVLISERELIEHCRNVLEPFKVPKKIIQVKKLPRGISGKIKLPEVRRMLENDSHRPGLDGSIDVDDIIALASTVFNTPVSRIDPDLSADEIPGWDSLGHLSLITAVEKKYGVEFSIEDMTRVDSLKTRASTLKKSACWNIFLPRCSTA